MKTKGNFILASILFQICLFSACDDPSSINNTPNVPNTPNAVQHTVLFATNGGIPAPAVQIIIHGGKINIPAPMFKPGYGFGGWYKEESTANEWNFIDDSVFGNITLYAKWDLNFHVVDFEANGGIPGPISQNIAHGSMVVPPPEITKLGYIFGGWYKEAALENKWDFYHDVINSDTTLYAKWDLPIRVIISGANFETKMNWLGLNAQSNYAYIIEINSNEISIPLVLSFSGKHNIYVTLRGAATKRIISLASSHGSLFTIESGVTLILDNNIELQGRNSNNAPLIEIKNGGNLILNNGASITSNSNSQYGVNNGGGGVNVNGTFIMYGGVISDNRHSGVYVDDGGTFIMDDGEISNNGGMAINSLGGGVRVYGGTFTMNGGVISGNSAQFRGGGVSVQRGNFIMNGGEISGNTANGDGGGVYSEYYDEFNSSSFTMNGGLISGNTAAQRDGGGVYSWAGLIMNGGKISGNTAQRDGGGVYLYRFTMNGGEISGNTAQRDGGGVRFSTWSGNEFAMNGGLISGNTAQGIGGGVYCSSPTFIKNGGIITGYSEGSNNSNVVKNSSGVIQQYKGHAIQVYINHLYSIGKDTTAGTTDNLSANRTFSSQTWSGNWDYQVTN